VLTYFCVILITNQFIFLVMASNNTMSILEAWSSETGELVDFQLVGALLCVGRLRDGHNLVAGGCL